MTTTPVGQPAAGVRTPDLDLRAERENEPVAGYALKSVPRQLETPLQMMEKSPPIEMVSGTTRNSRTVMRTNREEVHRGNLHGDQFLVRSDLVVVESAERLGNSNVFEQKDDGCYGKLSGLRIQASSPRKQVNHRRVPLSAIDKRTEKMR